MIEDLVRQNRSYRRFHEDVPVRIETLRALVNLARMSASGANKQPLKYILSSDRETNARIFPHTRWAGYLKDWDGPAEGERPAAYIVILGDTEISKSFGCDHGIAAQSIMLGAAERGLGGCIIGSIDKDRLRQTLDIPERYEILLVLTHGPGHHSRVGHQPPRVRPHQVVGPQGSAIDCLDLGVRNGKASIG
jgi:nitroreductase